MDLKTLDQLDLNGKTVIIRADVDVPIDDNGNVVDDTRLHSFLATLKEVTDKGARPIVLGHRGRPKGHVRKEFSLMPIARHLEKLVGHKVSFAVDCVDRPAEAAIGAMKPGDILLMENTRFHPEEEANDDTFSQKLAKLGDIFINDAFATAHRSHASTAGIARYIKDKAVGRGMESQIKTLEKILENPERPLLVVIGGAKISTKMGALRTLIRKANMLMIGGAMANTFLVAQGKPVGNSLFEPEYVDTARDILAEAGTLGCRILLPTDVTVAGELKSGVAYRHCSVNDIEPFEMAVDVGPKTIETWCRVMRDQCKTVFWNGPVGAAEVEPFNTGTNALAVAFRQTDAFTVLGGGDTVNAVKHASDGEGLKGIDYVSTAGGALLEFLEGRPLPALEALRG